MRVMIDNSFNEILCFTLNGIIILMNYKDHLPPHFHAIYNEYEIIVNIIDGEVKG